MVGGGLYQVTHQSVQEHSVQGHRDAHGPKEGQRLWLLSSEEGS